MNKESGKPPYSIALVGITAIIAAIALVLLYRNLAGMRQQPSSPQLATAVRTNPISTNSESIEAGTDIFTANCVSCHGITGKGDGPAADAFNPKPHDLTDPNVATRSDDDLFKQITDGKKPMPAFGKILSETDRWNVLNYIRSINRAADITKGKP